MSHARPEAPPHGFGQELRDAVGLRVFALVLGGLMIQLAFIVSYVGALHSPTPHRIPIAVVAPSRPGGRSWRSSTPCPATR